MSSLRTPEEFPLGAGDWPNELSRRRFLKLMGASIALASTTGCTRNPPEFILPYRRQPEEIIPGKPLFYATALTLGGYARGVLVETHEGRPTKIEGNPLHPASLGSTDVFMQAELLTLYDPERSQALTRSGQISTWDVFLGEISAASQSWKGNSGAGVRILTRNETSPTFLDQLTRLLAKFPGAKWHVWDPLQTEPVDALYHFDRAEVILSLGGDFLDLGPAMVRYTRDFAARRRPDGTMNRLYVAEPTPSLTGSMADHRFIVKPDELEAFAREIEIGGNSAAGRAIASDLRAHPARCLVVASQFASPAIHEAARRMNEALGNIGFTVDYVAPPPNGARDLRELVSDAQAGAVDTLFIIDGNPVYNAPADLEFAEVLKRIPHTAHVGLYQNETAALCSWHVPRAHALETWSDARAIDGTITIMQPMIEPLFAGRSPLEMFSVLLEEPPTNSYEVVRAFWQKQSGGATDFELRWRKSLHDGIANFELPNTAAAAAPTNESPQPAAASSTHLIIRPSLRLLDGRYANNAWAQELPHPLTKIVWDNAALVSPATAQRLQLGNGDVVRLKFRGRSVKAPIWILAGQADDCVTVDLGYGRTNAGSIGNGVGFNACVLRTSDALWGGAGLEIEKTGEHQNLVTTQHHWDMHDREQVRVGTFAQFQNEPHEIAKPAEPPPREEETLYPNYDYSTGHKWGMSIDLNTCIGCGVCTIACQAENNIPVVGKEQVDMNREMHWIRVDVYMAGDAANPRMLHQPVPCMHCETAPCELVCPVAATVHSSEGLNQMIYNRCIGTRYCSNNCPYKVRRFNFLEYDANQYEVPITRKLMRNPDVTVRARGVMEKCTYCIQRINAVKIESQKANRAIRDGEIIPACAQACPADAIIFGDLNDPNGRATHLRNSPLSYGLLAELNTRPRTTYLAKLRNPNPEVEE